MQCTLKFWPFREKHEIQRIYGKTRSHELPGHPSEMLRSFADLLYECE